MAKKKKHKETSNMRHENFNEAKANFKGVLSRNKTLGLSLLCLLYFLKVYDPIFAWFGAFGALVFYKDANKSIRKLSYISILGFLGFFGFFN
ncbi:MAG: hypothetical protein ACOWWR_11060 [Eubacteriales bacterium]